MITHNLATRDVYIEMLGPINFYAGLGLKMMMAIFLGVIIGVDREKKFKSAGIKTQVMICVGSTIYTSIGLLTMYLYRIGDNIDPNRLTAQIVSGIGFLGAGTIIQSRGNIIGLTTAATIWVVAAIGICIGSGYIFSALFFTVTILVILNLIEPFMKVIYREQLFQFEIRGFRGAIKSFNNLLEENGIHSIESETFESNDDSDKYSYHLTFLASTREMKRIISFLRSHPKIEGFTHRIIRKSQRRESS
jgi:putative Mg2+ transporter-C (MgtC) family protein